MVRALFMAVGIFAVALGALLVVAPTQYLDLYLMGRDADRVFAAQRLGPVVAGLGGLLWILRDLPRGVMLQRICLLTALVWCGVAATGVYHFATGTAQSIILVAAAIEVALAAAFVVAARQGRG